MRPPQEIDALGGTGVAVALDHRDDDAVEALFARVLDEHGRLDVLVNNAFIVTNELTSGLPVLGGPDLELGRHDRRRHPLGLRRQRVRGAGDGRRPASGLIVNISSSGAEEYAWQVAYGVGKCALDRITADTAHELAPHGVSVVSLWPGFVRTERIDVGAAAGLLPESLDLSTSESPRFTGRGGGRARHRSRRRPLDRSGRRRPRPGRRVRLHRRRRPPPRRPPPPPHRLTDPIANSASVRARVTPVR